MARNPYRELFTAPGTVAFTLAGLVARTPLAMITIGILTMLSLTTGQYGLAGAVSGTFTLSMALLGPMISRLVDRHGQRRVLLPAAALCVAGIAALTLAARFEAPTWTLFASAVLAGFKPDIGSMTRARWSKLYAGTPRLHTAFAFESVLDEVTFVAGPGVAVALCTILFPEAGPLAALALLTIGMWWFTAQRSTEPIPTGRPRTGGRSAIRDLGVVLVSLALAAGGMIAGTIDVISVALAESAGIPATAGIPVGLYAVGSLVAGLVFGAMSIRLTLPKLLILTTAGTALTTVPMLWVNGIVALTVVVFLSGMFFAPTMITAMTLVQKLVPADVRTEGMTWANTGLTAGIAIGAATSGAAVDRFGTFGGYVVAVAAGALLALMALISYRPLTARLTTRPAAREHESVDGENMISSPVPAKESEPAACTSQPK